MNLIRALSLSVFLFVSTLNAGYIYEAAQALIDLKTNYIATSYNLGAGDDQVSSTFNLAALYESPLSAVNTVAI